MDEQKKDKHLRMLIAMSFFTSVVASVAGWCFPPDFSVEPPRISEIGLLMGHLQTALIIIGCTALGVKLAEEKQTIAAIGFTMMSVTQGVIFVLYVVSPEPSKENLDEVYKLFTASLFLLIPSMLLIAFYAAYPRWLNITGVIATVPWVAENIIYFQQHKLSAASGSADFIGQVLMDVTIAFWGIFELRKGTRSAKKGHTQH